MASSKKLFVLFVIAAVAVTSFALPSAGLAAGDCGDFYTVQRGDYLRKIARLCETTLAALERANPDIPNPNRIYPGQVLALPGALIEGSGNTDTYIVQSGDTLNRLASRFDTTVDRLLDLNSQITSANTIYEGQRLAVPKAGSGIPVTGGTEVYVVARGDTLRKIAARFDTTVDELLDLNPGIANRNLIYVGQRLVVPSEENSYTVQRGDTLRKIAARFETSVDELLDLNPQIRDPNRIFVGQVLRVP